MAMSGQPHAPVPLPSRRRGSLTHSTEGWVGHITNLGMIGRENMLLPTIMWNNTHWHGLLFTKSERDKHIFRLYPNEIYHKSKVHLSSICLRSNQ
jgi:hypothetical protein